jgi:hypothetical protein
MSSDIMWVVAQFVGNLIIYQLKMVFAKNSEMMIMFYDLYVFSLGIFNGLDYIISNDMMVSE